MSKAFVNDDLPTPEILPQHRSLVGDSENYITRQGYERFQAELLRLEKEESQLNQTPSAQTDSRRQEIQQRVLVLKRIIESSVVIAPETQKGNRVLFGATVTVVDEDDMARVYKLVGLDETDAKVGKISWISPIGQALLQSRVGDIVSVNTPRKKEELEITSIEFKEIKSLEL